MQWILSHMARLRSTRAAVCSRFSASAKRALFAVATAFQLRGEMLIFPISPCLSVFMRRSSARWTRPVRGRAPSVSGPRCGSYQAVIMVISYAVRGPQIAFWAFFFLLSATAFGWFMRSEARGRAPRRPARGAR